MWSYCIRRNAPGIKRDSEGSTIDFNRVHAELIKPSLDATSLDVFHADEEQQADNTWVQLK